MTSAGTERTWLTRLGENPGALLTLAYLLVSLLGLCFSWALLREFNINVFSFADVTDFLMAAFREPMTFLLAVSALGVGLLLHFIAGWEIRWLERRGPRSAVGRNFLAFERTMRRYGVYTVSGFLGYTGLFILLFAHGEAGAIREGDGERVVVQVADDPTPVPGLLLGATSRFVFVYRPELGQAEAIPQENILRIRPAQGAPGP